MGIEIHWTDFAKRELNKNYIYYRDKVSVSVAKKITNQIVLDTLHLKVLPESGAIEELLKSRKQQFRYIVSTNYKVIYWVNSKENRIEIIDVFDTRQNPTKINRNKQHILLSYYSKLSSKIPSYFILI